MNLASNYLNAGVDASRLGSEHASIVPYQTFSTADGWLTVGCGSDAQFREYCGRIRREDLAQVRRVFNCLPFSSKMNK